MANHRHGDRLSWGDALFLYLEREGMPLNVASVCVFEGTISVEACTHHIASKLPRIPRYLQRVVSPPLNLGFPIWEFDPKFDIHNHVLAVTLKQGTEAEFKTLCGKILGKVMDRQRPLWDITLVYGLKGNRTGVVFRLHHCLADGIAGVEIMNELLGTVSSAPRVTKRKRNFRKPPQLNPLTSLLDGWISSCGNLVQGSLAAQSEVANIAGRMFVDSNSWPAAEFSKLVPELTVPTEPLHFNVTYRGPQKYAWTEIPLSDVKAIRHACGVSVNDVVLALVTMTIRRYAEMHRNPIRKRLLRMMVPVNLRGNGNAADLGNRISLLPVTVPLDIRNPRRLLLAVHERTEFLKRAHVAELVGLAGTLLGMIATPLQALLGPFASQLPVAPFNLVCTNVPGPQFPLYLLGHKMLQWYPYVPVGGEMTLNCAILSYNGTMYFGFSGCSQAAPDLGRLTALLRSNLAQLGKAVHVPTTRTTKARRVFHPSFDHRDDPAPETLRMTIPLAVPSPTIESPMATSPEEEGVLEPANA